MTSMGIATPMTPVDATSTCEVRIPSSAAARDAVSRASFSPRSPVQALAQPEFATIARIASPSSCEMFVGNDQRRGFDIVGRDDGRADAFAAEVDERKIGFAPLDARHDAAAAHVGDGTEAATQVDEPE